MWVLLLSLALLCVQSSQLHIHSLGHGHDTHHSHTMDELADHLHLSKAHLIHDTSHSDHHSSLLSNIEINPDESLKKTHHTTPAIALFVLFFSLILSPSSQQIHPHYHEAKRALYSRYTLSPPLRAPPTVA
ncbi:MAG: hypothetical protein L3J62_09740 [Gammaproteobacteria bacterium]|nr:hypothetical protein [Gammaproteobacteria bacterium]MCF6231046.1 hypothetical protein [Gammaproteobacteria bacterium]